MSESGRSERTTERVRLYRPLGHHSAGVCTAGQGAVPGFPGETLTLHHTASPRACARAEEGGLNWMGLCL